MNSVSKIKKNVFTKNNWSSMAKSALAIGLMAEATQAMENPIDTVLNHTDILTVIYHNMEDNKPQFEEVCWTWRKAANEYNQQFYGLKNKEHGFGTWEDCIFVNPSDTLSQKIIFISNNLYNDLLKCHIYNNGQPMNKDLFEIKSQKLLCLPNLPKESEAHKKFEIIQKMGAEASPDYFLDDAMEFFDEKKYDEAALYDILALEKKGNNTEIQDYTMCFDALTKAEKHDKALNYMDKAIALFSTLTEKVNIIDGLEEIARSFYQAKNYSKATDYNKMALNMKGDETDMDYIYLFNSLTGMQLHEEANEYMDLAIEKADGDDFCEIAKSFGKAGQYDKAIQYGKMGIEKTENNWPGDFINLAKAFTKLGNHKEADRYIQLMIENLDKNATYEWLFRSIAKFLTGADRLEEAAKYQEMAELEKAKG